MSTLLVDELFDGVEFTQVVRLHNSLSIAFVRPWIYKQGTLQDGQFQLRIYDGATLLKTVNIDYTEINAAITEPYAHGYIRFNTEPIVLSVGNDVLYYDYTLKFRMINHTTDEDNYIAICRDWEKTKYPIFGTLPDNDIHDPAGYELYGFRNNDWQR
jgi:hypothetical protein